MYLKRLQTIQNKEIRNLFQHEPTELTDDIHNIALYAYPQYKKRIYPNKHNFKEQQSKTKLPHEDCTPYNT